MAETTEKLDALEDSRTSTPMDDHTKMPNIEKSEAEDRDLSKEEQHTPHAGATETENSEPQYPGTLKVVLIVTSLLVTVFLVALDQTIIGTAIPKITDQFHSVEDVGWYGSAYFLTSTALQPTYGRIYKIFDVSNRHVVLLLRGILLYSLSILLTRVTPKINRSNGRFLLLFSCSNSVL